MSAANQSSQEPIAAFVGIDWADEKHDIALRANEPEAKVERTKIANQPEALSDWVLALRERFKQGKILICLEQSRGALMHFLMGYDCFELYPINPTQLENYRKAFKPSGAKDDPTDGELLCKYLSPHHQELRRPFERRCCAARSRQIGDNSPREVSLTNKKAGDTPRASAHRSDGVVPSRGGPLPNRHLVGSRVARHDPDISGCESPVEGDRSQQNEPGTEQAWPLPSRRSTAGLPQNTLTNPAFYAASETLSDSPKNRTERRSMRHKTGCGITPEG
jgi:hypothetical protein